MTKPTAVPSTATMTPSWTVFHRMRRLTGLVSIELTISHPSADRATVRIRMSGSPTMTKRRSETTVTRVTSVRSRPERRRGRGEGVLAPTGAAAAGSSVSVMGWGSLLGSGRDLGVELGGERLLLLTGGDGVVLDELDLVELDHVVGDLGVGVGGDLEAADGRADVLVVRGEGPVDELLRVLGVGPALDHGDGSDL